MAIYAERIETASVVEIEWTCDKLGDKLEVPAGTPHEHIMRLHSGRAKICIAGQPDLEVEGTAAAPIPILLPEFKAYSVECLDEDGLKVICVYNKLVEGALAGIGGIALGGPHLVKE